MPQRNVQELWGLKPEETNALAVLSGLEGYRGGKGEDVAAVAANALQRRLHEATEEKIFVILQPNLVNMLQS